MTCGKNEDTWQRYVEVETHRHQDTGAPRGLAKVQGKVQGRVRQKQKQKAETMTRNMFVLWARKDTRKQTANSRLRRGKVGLLKSGVSKHEQTRD